MKATKRALEVLHNCLEFGNPKGQDFPFHRKDDAEWQEKIKTLPQEIGLRQEEFDRFKVGDRLLSDVEFYKLLRFFLYPFFFRDSFTHAFKEDGYWAFVGLLKPVFSLERRRTGIVVEKPIQAILDYPHMFIDDPDLPLEEGDTFVHTRRSGIVERLAVDYVEYWPYPEDFKPAYYLKLARWKPKMEKDEYGCVVSIGGDTPETVKVERPVLDGPQPQYPETKEPEP